MTPDDFWRALALVGVIEGMAYALFPAQIKRMMELARLQPDDTLRYGGLLIAALSVMGLWMI